MIEEVIYIKDLVLIILLYLFYYKENVNIKRIYIEEIRLKLVICNFIKRFIINFK